jgi:hypothetical protein
MTDADRFKPDAAQDSANAQEQTNREEAGAGTSSSSQKTSANEDYTNQRHNCNDRRTDVRTTDRHYSWREVYAATHVRPGR